MSNTIDLNALLAPVSEPTKRTKPTSAPSVPSLALPTTDRPSLLTLTGLTKTTARHMFDLMREQAQSATSDTTMMMTDTARAVMLVTCTAKTRKTAPLDAPPCDAVFTFNAPKRDTSRTDTNAHASMPCVARLACVLLSHVAPKTHVRAVCIALDAKRDMIADNVMITPNTHDPLVVIITFAIALRPCCDTLTLDLINTLCDALALPRPTLA